MSSAFGTHLRLSLFGQSHGEAIGVIIDGFPAGMTIDMERLRHEAARRAPGGGDVSTARRETDEAALLSGVLRGKTTGQPICILIRNSGMRSADYGDAPDLARPSHADYTGHVRYYGFEDWRGGGSFSGRLTAPLVAAGTLCAQWLEGKGVSIASHILSAGDVRDLSFAQWQGDKEMLRQMRLPTLRAETSEAIAAAILAAKAEGDSVGGEVECVAEGLPAGLGAPFFDSVESVLSHLMFSIPGVKGVSFGDGFQLAKMRGSMANDPIRVQDGRVVTETNRAGGINGGITNGMPVLLTCAIRPTPSIARPQRTISMQRMENAELSIHGRHDPCILPRVCPVVEAMMAIGLMELWKEREACIL